MPSSNMRKIRTVVTSQNAQKTSDNKSPNERRTQPRFSTQFRSIFSGSCHEGHGRTLDISVGGCKVESEMPVTIGHTFECRLHIPGLDWPLRIEEVTVRWVEGKTFGVSFTHLHPQELAKLETVLARLSSEN